MSSKNSPGENKKKKKKKNGTMRRGPGGRRIGGKDRKPLLRYREKGDESEVKWNEEQMIRSEDSGGKPLGLGEREVNKR